MHTLLIITLAIALAFVPAQASTEPDSSLAAGLLGHGKCYRVNPGEIPPVEIYECPDGQP